VRPNIIKAKELPDSKTTNLLIGLSGGTIGYKDTFDVGNRDMSSVKKSGTSAYLVGPLTFINQMCQNCADGFFDFTEFRDKSKTKMEHKIIKIELLSRNFEGGKEVCIYYGDKRCYPAPDTHINSKKRSVSNLDYPCHGPKCSGYYECNSWNDNVVIKNIYDIPTRTSCVSTRKRKKN
jgi:hypothetical protein